MQQAQPRAQWQLQPDLAEDLTGWLGSDDLGSQENDFAEVSPLPMPGLGNHGNNLTLKILLGMGNWP